MSKLTVSAKFADMSEELGKHARELAELMEGATALFEAEGATGVRYLCLTLEDILYAPVYLTPKLASIFLELEENNRPSNKETVDAYARDMTDDKWMETAAAVTLDHHGILRDGGHRCRAVQQSGRTIRTLVAFGIVPGAALNIDSGRVRSMGNFLAILGEKDVSNMQSVVPRLIAWDKGIFVRPARVEKRTREEVVAYLQDNPGVREALVRGRRLSRLVLGYSPAGASMSEIIVRRSGLHEEADKFFTDLATGANLSPGSAVLELRNTLAEGTRRRRGRGRESLTMEEQIAYTIEAWNRRNDGDVRLLRLPGTLNDVNFPQVKEAPVTPRKMGR